MAYSAEQKQNIINTICERIANGESVRAILKDDNLPAFNTFLIWVSESDEKSKQYEYAMKMRAEVLFEETLEIADDSSNDIEYGEHGQRMNTEYVQRSRLRVDTRKWYLSKLNPKKFGDRVQNEFTGEGGGAIKVVFNEIRNYESDN